VRTLAVTMGGDRGVGCADDQTVRKVSNVMGVS